MAAAQLLTRVSTHSARAFAPQLIASSKGFSSASSASSARNLQTSHLLQSQRLGRHFVATSAVPSWVPFIGKQRKQGNNSVLNWARTTRMACQVAPAKAPSGQDIATFAGGCFWGVELAFQRVPGVTKTSVGYTAGHDKAPTYNSVCSGQTGHTEAVQVYYDPKETDYTKLLDCFFQHVDPTTLNQQGGDRGTQYRSGIYYHNEEQKHAAEKAIAEVNKKLKSNVFRRVMGSEVVSELEPASDYYTAEEYHQQYLEKGGRFSSPQSAAKGATERIRCYG
ncbi:hypothetical protein WJX79_010510 [Trebouxia sp. C0005]|nr:MAG: peptide methionine sulfoxide reductase-like [Trebouxia sp. A1-2]